MERGKNSNSSDRQVGESSKGMRKATLADAPPIVGCGNFRSLSGDSFGLRIDGTQASGYLVAKG